MSKRKKKTKTELPLPSTEDAFVGRIEATERELHKEQEKLASLLVSQSSAPMGWKMSQIKTLGDRKIPEIKRELARLREAHEAFRAAQGKTGSSKETDANLDENTLSPLTSFGELDAEGEPEELIDLVIDQVFPTVWGRIGVDPTKIPPTRHRSLSPSRPASIQQSRHGSVPPSLKISFFPSLTARPRSPSTPDPPSPPGSPAPNPPSPPRSPAPNQPRPPPSGRARSRSPSIEILDVVIKPNKGGNEIEITAEIKEEPKMDTVPPKEEGKKKGKQKKADTEGPSDEEIERRLVLPAYINSINGVPVPLNVKTRIKRFQSSGALFGMTSKFIVLQVFINQGYRSVCHYHAEIDHSIAKNDDSRKKSTGVYKPVGESCAPEELRRLIPKKKPSSIEVLEGAVEWPEKGPTQTSNGLTMDDLLKFYRKVDGWYFLTCGCLLDDVLLDFYIWKAQQYIPSMYGHETPFGTPMEPRVRTWLFAFLKSEMDICVDNLYAYDEDGVYRSWERRSVIQIKNIWHSLERKAARSMVLDALNPKEKGADLEPWEWSDKDRKSEQEARKALQREWEKASKEEREREEQRRKELEEEDAWMDGGKEEDGERKKRKKKKKKSREEDEGEGKEKKKKKKKRKASRSPSPSDPSGSRPKKRKSD